jgi:hypothetical protein
MTKPARKPLRRTAWSLLLGGLGVAAVMLGVGAYAVSKGASAGPGQSATWPAGKEISIDRPLGVQQGGDSMYSVICTVTPEAGEPTRTRLSWGERNQPEFAGSAAITCDQAARVLTEPELTIAINTRGPLIAVPLFAAGLGGFLFFPRFTMVAASLSHPFGRIVDRLTRHDRRDPFI